MNRLISIAIDGPAGSGKSTVAKTIAERLKKIYVDTGAMYRAVAWKSIQEGIPLSDESAIVEMTQKMQIRFERGIRQKIFADDVDVSEAIRTPEVSRLSSPVSAIPGVRTRLVELQREFGSHGNVVMEGRDIGTVVLPNAELKIFLTASPEVRAKRRLTELKEKGYQADYEQVLSEIRERDLRDSTRAVAPLRQAPDAILVNTDLLSIEQVVEKILDLAREKDC
jgi:cytidylate kinase